MGYALELLFTCNSDHIMVILTATCFTTSNKTSINNNNDLFSEGRQICIFSWSLEERQTDNIYLQDTILHLASQTCKKNTLQNVR